MVHGNKTWHAHRIILCCQSLWFDKALRNPFAESETRVIVFQDDDSFAEPIEHMIHFMYRYTSLDLQNRCSPLTCAMLYALADKYEILDLRLFAVEQCSAATLRVTELQPFLDTVNFIYEYTTSFHRELRNCVLRPASGNLHTLLRCHSFIRTLEINGEFGRELLQCLSKMPVREGVEGDEKFIGFAEHKPDTSGCTSQGDTAHEKRARLQ